MNDELYSKSRIHVSCALGALLVAWVMPVIGQQSVESDDGSYITIGGKVVSQAGKNFTLDYDNGTIVVEMDDWDSFNEAQAIKPGETVTVRGRIDVDLFENRTIEAESVYIADRHAQYFASAMDEEDALDWSYGIANPEFRKEGTWYSVSGTITHIDGTEFILDTGVNLLDVDTSTLDYSPFDDSGYQKLHVGDYVHVAGKLDEKVFENNEINAVAITSYE